MTWEELNEVRNLNEDLRSAEQSLNLLRLSVAAKVPVINGIPKTTTPESRVEITALRITEMSREVDELKAQIMTAIPILKQKLKASIPDKKARKLFILRYIDCLHFRDIGFALGYSEAHVYYIHRTTLEKLIVDNNK